jgi:hypothetical protein
MSLVIEMNRNLSLPSRIKSRLLSLSLEAGSFSRRGFPGCHSSGRAHLERVVQTFIQGYNLAVGEADVARLTERLDSSFPTALVGFAYEGAGMYFGLIDLLVPRSTSRLAAFTRSPTAYRQDYIATVGAGCAIARAPFGLRRLESYQRSLDPMSAWCLADGYGFHQGFFHWKRFIEARQAAPASLNPQNRRLFDAGVGRAMWWVFGADPDAIAGAISRFDDDRRPEMWAGIGTALAYAGGGPPQASSLLLDLSGEYSFDLLSGIPFAAHMRDKGGNAAEWTAEVCAELLGMSVAETSGIIVAEVAAYLNSWRGTEQDKWDTCYVALRDRVKQRLANGRGEPPYSFASAEGDCEEKNDNYN